MDPPHQLLGEDAVEAFELPSPSRIVRATIDYGDPSLSTVAPKLLRYEATPVVDVELSRLATALGGPPEVVGGYSSSLSSVRAGHHEVPRTVVQDGVDIEMSSNPRASELVDVHLPKGVDVTPLNLRTDWGFRSRRTLYPSRLRMRWTVLALTLTPRRRRRAWTRRAPQAACCRQRVRIRLTGLPCVRLGLRWGRRDSFFSPPTPSSRSGKSPPSELPAPGAP
jgi:hypothetical protein